VKRIHGKNAKPKNREANCETCFAPREARRQTRKEDEKEYQATGFQENKKETVRGHFWRGKT